MPFTRKDFWAALVTGFYAGFSFWLIAGFLALPLIGGFSYGWLVLILPLLWVGGVWLGYFLGRWFGFFNQFGKFAAIGFTNFAVDLGVLNILIAQTGITKGLAGFALIRTGAAAVAIVHSYLWNRGWVFASQQGNIVTEFGRFIMVAAIASAVNIGIASAVVNWIDPPAVFTPERWDNVAAIVGSAVALILNFVILRQKVFKHPNA